MKSFSLPLFLVFTALHPGFSQDNFKIITTLQQKRTFYDYFIGCVYVQVADHTDSVAMRSMVNPIKKTVLQNAGKEGLLRLEMHFMNSRNEKLGVMITDLSYEQQINYERIAEYRGRGNQHYRGPEQINALISEKKITLPMAVIGIWSSGGTFHILYQKDGEVKSKIYWTSGDPVRNTLSEVKMFKEGGETIYRTYFTTDRGKDSIDHVVNKYGDLEQHYVYPNFRYLDRKVVVK